MNDDLFQRFERSRGGLLIPVLLFILGAVPTILALRAMNPLAVLQDAPPAQGEFKPAVDNAAADEPEFSPQEPSVQ